MRESTESLLLRRRKKDSSLFGSHLLKRKDLLREELLITYQRKVGKFYCRNKNEDTYRLRQTEDLGSVRTEEFHVTRRSTVEMEGVVL